MIVNPSNWFSKREIDHRPPHFVKCDTPITPESRIWVTSKLKGRYAIVHHTDMQTYIMETRDSVYFEDPAEAMIYELRWSGVK
jgi:hypothetical protein